jgi:hypothetical protein
VSRWLVQLEARFAKVWTEAVEEQVAEHLDRAGVLFDRDNGVQGDPGPILCATLVIEAADAETAGAAGWEMYREALAVAAVDDGDYRLERTVTRSMDDVERRFAEMRAMHAAMPAPGKDGASAAVWAVRRDTLRPPDGAGREQP